MFRHPLILLIALLGMISCDQESQVDCGTREGILILGNSNEPKGLDPQAVSGVLESNIIGALFEGLISPHPSDDIAFVLSGAEALEPDASATVWTVRLRQNAVWNDDTPITSEDYLFSYHRMLSPEFGAKYAEMLYFLKNGAPYNKDERGEILFRISPPDAGPSWSDLAEVTFRPFSKSDAAAKLDALGGREWPELNESERAIFLSTKGLDMLDAEQLDWIAEAPEKRFLWPADFTHAQVVIERLRAFSGQDLWAEAKVGVEALDKFTLRLTLRGPTPYFTQIAKHYTWNPVPKHAVLRYGKMSEKGNPWSKLGKIVSNGPFQLKSWRLTDHLEVERSPSYWDAANVTLNGVRFLPITNSYTEARMFRDDQLHITYTAPPEVIDLMKRIQPEVLRQEPYVGTVFYRCNTTKKPLNDPRIRLALSLAINRDIICDKVLKGYLPAWGMTPPMAGYKIAKRKTYDPERAKELFAEAGYPDGEGFPKRLKILLASRETAATLAQAIQAMWRDTLGIEVEIENKEWTAYLDAMQRLDYDIAAAGWIGDYLDPLTFLEMWTTGNGNNLTGWDNPSFEKTLNQSHMEVVPAKRYDLLRTAENLLVDESPVILIAWYSRNYLLHPAVKNWNPLLLDNHSYDKIRLEPLTQD